jgi:hypothetical protein
MYKSMVQPLVVYVHLVLRCTYTKREEPPMNTTKTPTTYSRTLPGDMIDGDVVIAKSRDNGQVALQFASTLTYGPWQPANTPVSVWR